MKRSAYVAAIAAMTLSSCSSTPPREVAPEAPQTPLTVKPTSSMDSDMSLRLVTRGHTGKAAAATTLTNVLGIFAGGQPMRTFKKEQLKGERLEQLPNPSRDALPQLLQERLRAYAQSNVALRPPVKFEVVSETWLLVYEDLNATDAPYELRYTTTIVARPAADTGKSLPDVSLRCAPVPASMPLAQWEADEYAQVRQTTQAYVADCVEQVTAHFPELFKPPVHTVGATAPHEAGS